MISNDAIGVSDEDEDDDDFLGDDEWEDEPTYASILAALPEGWHLVKIVNYTFGTLVKMREWCSENADHAWKEVGWQSGCSYSTAVQFEDLVDATLFKLRWG